MTECPHCGQPMRVMFGIRFTPMQAAVLSMVVDVTKGRGAIEINSLITCFYSGVNTAVARARVRSIICHINDGLVSTDYKIFGYGSKKYDYFYKFIEEKETKQIKKREKERQRDNERQTKRAYRLRTKELAA